MSDAPRYKKWVDIGGLTLAVVGVFTYFYGEYLDDKRAREAAVLDRVQTLQTEPLLDLRLTILQEFSDKKTQLFLIFGPTESELGNYVTDKLKDNTDLRNSIIRLVYFFDEIQTCVEAEQCSEKKSMSWMQQDAAEVNSLFGPYIGQIALQSGLPRLGCGMSKFATGKHPVRCASAP
ncbi:hypothetical protein WNY61_07795 [Sulfitobacter sp. AS92]|uniref:hypothetical protein n=1 Tax=Sulfitobacter sp. AS92 TaxID=3135783 RepID=UPI003175A396